MVKSLMCLLCSLKRFPHNFTTILDDPVHQTQNNPAFYFVCQPLIKGENFKLVGHVIRLILTALCTIGFSICRKIFLSINF